MSDAIFVEARVAHDGSLHPRAFVWRERRYAVASVGRRWTDAGEAHMLVMAEGGGTFELAFKPDSGVWRLVRTPKELGPHPTA